MFINAARPCEGRGSIIFAYYFLNSRCALLTARPNGDGAMQ
jgi:hypothetical protein